MKRNKKYNKERPKRNLMNGLSYIVLFLGIGILSAQDPPEEFQYYQSTMQAFYYFDSVAINGIEVESNDWVGAFNGDVCVGARQWDTSECGSGVCDVPVMGDDGLPETEGYMMADESPTFKIYDASSGEYYDATPSEIEPWENFSFINIEELNGYIWGCTNSDACNYDENATMDDNSCLDNDCAEVCGGLAELDACGVCGGEGIPTGDCDCSGNIVDCAGECGGSAVVDECGECGGDNSSCQDCAGNIVDCAGECGGSAVVDNCGVCDSNSNNDNTECWFIDITTSVGDLGIIDTTSRIGMHVAAADDFNIADSLDYDCENCYKDEVDIHPHSPTNYIDFYFPHPEWGDEIPEIFGSTDLKKDIRYLEEYTMASFDSTTSIIVDDTIYYIQQQWDIMIDTDQNVSNQNNVKLDFDFVNEISISGPFTKIFFYREIPGDILITEITQDGGSIILDDYDFLLSNFKIILGTDTAQPKVTVVSPLPNEIFGLENDNFSIVLDMENSSEIGHLDFSFEVDGETLDAISIPADQWQSEDESGEQFTVYIDSSGYHTWLDGVIGERDFIENINIFIEIIDRAGNTGAGNGYDSEQVGPLTFSRNESNFTLYSGWHLLSSPLDGDDGENIFNDLFYFPAYDCSDGCGESDTFDPFETANSGTGFYVKSNGESRSFTGDVLSKSISTLKQGWNLIGNPLVNSVDINSVIITHNNYDYNWTNAAKNGIISPTPIIYDNENGGHIGTSELSTAAGFWVHSFHDDVEISFIPSNPVWQDVDGDGVSDWYWYNLDGELLPDPDDYEENEASDYWNLSLFAKENNAGTNYDESIGSEIVIGIHEDAHDTFVNGEDQEIFPLSEMNIFNSYSKLSINNDGQNSLLYRDIRSYKDTLSTWDISVESINPFSNQGIVLSWEKPGPNDPYKYYVDISGDSLYNCKSGSNIDNINCYDMTLTDEIFLDEAGNIKITSVLKHAYIGCTNSLASNHNEQPNGDICEGGTCLGGNDAEFCEILSLLLPEETLYLDEGEAFDLPIELVNPGGTPIEGLQFVLEYDATMIALDTLTLSENFSQNFGSNYTFYQSENSNGQLSTLTGVLYFTGETDIFATADTLFNLSGIGIEDVSTIISLSSVQINENSAFGNICDIVIGSGYLTISGKLNYYKNEVPVSDGSIRITDANLDITTTSNGSGNFSVDSLIANSSKTYELIISKDEYEGNIEGYFDGLSAVDASRIARHAVDLYNFDDDELIAANVIIDYRCEDDEGDPMGTYDEEGECLTLCNKDDCEQTVENYDWVPNIEAGDASRVARYAAGIIEDLDDQCDPHWVFLNPDDEIMIHQANCSNLPNYNNFVRNYNTEGLMSDTTFIFKGIRLGDVTGNWTAPLGRENDENIVENPMVDVEVGQIVKLPLYLPNKVEIEGLDLTIQYDPEVFTLIGFNNNNSILERSTYNTIINDDTPGMFKLVSYANSVLINDNGLLGYIKFKVVRHTMGNSTIRIDEMKINDIQEGGFLVEGNFESSSITYGFDFQISAVPEVFALNKNYPNPFNPSTNIKFELPNDGDVQIFIYDLKGSLIDELVNGYMEAGYYNLQWDGSHKASGVYFIQMIADNGNYIKMTKMMLVK